jgi:hypothetical protein
MRKVLSFFCLLIFSYSCEKSDYIAKNTLNTNFSQKILDGYFVISITFDNNGNARIGTFKQGLIKYNSNETVVFNSENSKIPDNVIILF